MIKDLQEKIILDIENVTNPKEFKSKDYVAALPFNIVKNGKWNLDIFDMDWFKKEHIKDGKDKEYYIKDFNNRSDKMKLTHLITLYYMYDINYLKYVMVLTDYWSKHPFDINQEVNQKDVFLQICKEINYTDSNPEEFFLKRI